MEHENSLPDKGDTSTVYVIGAIVVVAVIIAAILLWPKPKTETAQEQPTTPVATSAPVKKPNFTKLTCERQWYNPVIGFPKYYLSAEGGDINSVNATECVFTVTNGDKVIATERANAVFTPAPDRGGSSFTCTTKAVELPKTPGLTLSIVVKNDQNQQAACPSGALNL